MARHFFPPGVLLLPPGEDRQVFIAANTPFTFWSESKSGEQYTDIVTPSGVQEAVLITDEKGERPSVRGPDGVKVMWCDGGSGQRYVVYASDALTWLLDNYEGPWPPTGDIHGGTF